MTARFLFVHPVRRYSPCLLPDCWGSSLVLYGRLLCSDSSKPNKSASDSTKHDLQPTPIQPVSYPLKPKDQLPKAEFDVASDMVSVLSAREESKDKPKEVSYSSPLDSRASWTREDIRYVKDVAPISLISYPTRAAPLPDDIIEEEQEKKEEESNAAVERERARLEYETHARRGAFRMEKEEVVVPFPRLIHPIKKEKMTVLELKDAIREVKANSRKSFDETVEAHARLGISKSRSDLIVRGTLSLPHGEKKVLRVAVFADGRDADEARAAGADVVGGAELVDEIASGSKIEFDKCFTTPKLYHSVAKLARILNRLGLMPDSKQGTVVTDVSRAVQEAKKNQIKFKMDKTSIVHIGLGKVSYEEECLRENVAAFMNALLLAKPSGLKKTSKYAGYVISFHLCSTMGKGYPVSIQSISKAADHYSKLSPK